MARFIQGSAENGESAIHRLMHRLAAWLIFPVSFSLVFGASLVALDRGISVANVTGLATLGSVVLVARLERIQPFAPFGAREASR